MSAILIKGWDRQVLPATAEAIRSAIADAESRYEDAYVILEMSPQIYIQTYHERAGFILEKRLGNAESHFRAENTDTSLPPEDYPAIWNRLLEIGPRRSRRFTGDQIVAAFLAFIEKSVDSPSVQWRLFKV